MINGTYWRIKMSFRDELNNSVQTPEQFKEKQIKDAYTWYYKEIRGLYHNIKRDASEKVKCGKYTVLGNKKVISGEIAAEHSIIRPLIDDYCIDNKAIYDLAKYTKYKSFSFGYESSLLLYKYFDIKLITHMFFGGITGCTIFCKDSLNIRSVPDYLVKLGQEDKIELESSLCMDLYVNKYDKMNQKLYKNISKCEKIDIRSERGFDHLSFIPCLSYSIEF